MDYANIEAATPEARLRVVAQVQNLLAKVTNSDCSQSELLNIKNALSLVNSGNFSFVTENEGALPTLVANYFKNNPKVEIYIVGYMRIPPRQIEGIAKAIGIPFEHIKVLHDVEHQGRNKEIFDGLLSNPHVGAVLFGPTPHSMPRSEGSGFIGYQRTLNEKRPDIETRLITTMGGKVKITKEGLKRTLKQVVKCMVLTTV